MEVDEKFMSDNLTNEIKVGDEVSDGLFTFVVVSVYYGRKLRGITKDGEFVTVNKDNVKFTGRHFPQIPEVLKQMNNEIRVGDECVYKGAKNPFIVTNIYYENKRGFFDGVSPSGKVVYDGTLDLIRKTGRSCPELITALNRMKEMGNNNEG